MTGGTATHDAIVWGSTPEEQARRRAADDPVLKVPITSELGCITPFIIPPWSYTPKQLEAQAADLVVAMTSNVGCNCNSAKVLVLPADWSQADAFMDCLRAALKQTPLDPAYYAGIHSRYDAFKKQYPNCEVVEAPAVKPTRPLSGPPLPYLINVMDKLPAEPHKEYAFNVEPFAPVLTVVRLPTQGVEAFLAESVRFANDDLWGSLSCMIILHPDMEKAHPEACRKAVDDLRFGVVSVNAWSAVSFVTGAVTWGAFAGDQTIKDVRSGLGVVGNPYLVDGVQKAVYRVPIDGEAVPKPPAMKPIPMAAARLIMGFVVDGWRGLVQGPVAVGDELELECARLALEGKGVCLLPPSGFVVLVERTLPGEKVLAKITLAKKGYAEATKLASLAPHTGAVEPRCAYFGPCGGCTLQSLDYSRQLVEKRNQVEQTLRRVGKLGPALDAIAVARGAGETTGVLPAVAAAETYAYRNKLMFHFSSRCWLPPSKVVDRPALGLLRPGSADVVLPVTQHGCQLQDETANAVLKRVEQWVAAAGVKPYNDKSGKGILKHVVIRRGSGSSGSSKPEYMVVFGVTTTNGDEAAAALQPLAEALGREFPTLVSVAAAYHITDTLGGLTFQISAASFFQTNTAQAAVLYDVVRQAAALRPGRQDSLVDLYCGTGTISLSLAPECKSVLGVEAVAAAVSDARLNARLNGASNALFVAAGARDLDRLCNGDDAPYRLTAVTPVDMFPHTDHVETVAVLERAD
eukprot:XP_001690781.1 tRNA (uracil-5-)-methyltransferase [Chlamydomonas reinhardtii]